MKPTECPASDGGDSRFKPLVKFWDLGKELLQYDADCGKLGVDGNIQPWLNDQFSYLAVRGEGIQEHQKFHPARIEPLRVQLDPLPMSGEVLGYRWEVRSRLIHTAFVEFPCLPVFASRGTL